MTSNPMRRGHDSAFLVGGPADGTEHAMRADPKTGLPPKRYELVGGGWEQAVTHVYLRDAMLEKDGRWRYRYAGHEEQT